ncbi:hypothetical protein H4R33_000708 [Dimargaris cristalligena]|nr:hypothetical protein H4R33_000708 [Dimargaris cristalligena]
MKIVVSTLSLFWMAQLAMIAASPVLTPFDNQEALSAQENQPQMKLQIPTVSDYTLEYDNLSQDQKHSLIDVFKFEFNLGYYPFADSYDDDNIDSKLDDISDAYQNRRLPEIKLAIEAYVDAEKIAGTRWKVVDFLALTHDQMYAMSPMLGLAVDGNIDLVVELQNRLASYCGSASFKKAFNLAWAPAKQTLFDAADAAYGIHESFECTAEQADVVQLATLFTLASVNRWDSMVHYLTSIWDTWTSAPWRLSVLGLMLLVENDINPLVYPFYHGLDETASFVREIQLCAEKFGFRHTEEQYAMKWNAALGASPDNSALFSEITECPFDSLGNKIRYDVANNAVGFVVDSDIMKGTLGDRPSVMSSDSVLAGPIPEILINTPNARFMQSALDSA